MAIRTTLRLPFAFYRLNERYRDLTTIDSRRCPDLFAAPARIKARLQKPALSEF
jgi:hypothetical protein